MLRTRDLIIVLWAGHSLGWGGQSLQLAHGPAMADLTDTGFSEFTFPEIIANMSAVFSGDSEVDFARALMSRQARCRSGTYPCSSWCCASGDTCQPAGCCPGTSRQCSQRGCYYPSSQICCSDGVVCRSSDTCVGGGCCRSGEAKCGNGCYDPRRSVCCSTGRTCPLGYDCMEGGGCCPKGHKPCGNTKCYDPKTQTCCTGPGTVWACSASQECCAGGYCRDPATQKCCENGACDKDTTCCARECCRSIAYCGSGGTCLPCPATTRTVTATTSALATVVRTVTVTSDPASEAEEVPEFSCIPMTVTNAEGATLELGDDCALKYEPPEPTTTTTTNPAAAVAIRGARIPELAASVPFLTEVAAPLQARQMSCRPYTTVTTTQWVTVSATTTSTTSRTVAAGPPEEESFSCPEMEATNAAGDVLALDESCVLNFEPAETTDASPPGATEVTDQSGNGGGGDTSGGSRRIGGSVTSVVGGGAVIWVALLLM
ncbi:hypothetical protein MFIFM68171_09629 [Madurella fahalii]|uniref:GPI anchored protein n=1 Tax=Madurella fahalii TaxID=1157608 RepID=A0ABQ0GNW7_9PEZI